VIQAKALPSATVLRLSERKIFGGREERGSAKNHLDFVPSEEQKRGRREKRKQKQKGAGNFKAKGGNQNRRWRKAISACSSCPARGRGNRREMSRADPHGKKSEEMACRGSPGRVI